MDKEEYLSRLENLKSLHRSLYLELETVSCRSERCDILNEIATVDREINNILNECNITSSRFEQG
jgi:hypothetical protein